MSGIIFVNPHSGDGSSPGVDDVADAFPEHRVEACEPSELERRIEEALDERPDFVGVAGGDGSVNAAAGVLRGVADVPLLVVPLGTRNHFARQVGIDTLDAAMEALTKGQTSRIAVGEVRGRHFVNNASIGVYPSLVRRRQAHARRVPTILANIAAGWDLLRHGRRIDVEVVSQTHPAWMLFVGNGRYGDHLLDLADRTGLEERVLDVRLVRADGRFSRLRVVGALLFGSLSRSRLVHRHVTARADFDVKASQVEIALDGEVELMEPPLTFASHSESLIVFTNAQG